MADFISQIKLPNRDESYLLNTVHYIVGTAETVSSSTAGNWVAVDNTVTTLYDGLMIIYVTPSAGNGSGTTRTLTNANSATVSATYTWLKFNGVWKKCYYKNSSTNLTTQYNTANTPIQLVYQSTLNGNDGGWVTLEAYYSSDINTYTEYAGETTGTTGLFPCTLVMRTKNDRLDSIVTTNSTATGKTQNSTGFIVGEDVFYIGNYTVAANTSLHSTRRTLYSFVRRIDFRYSSNCGTTLTPGLPVYLKGIIGDDGYFYLANLWWTHVIDLTNSDYVYVRIGGAYNNYLVDLYEHNHWLWFDGYEITPYALTAHFGTKGALTFGDPDDPMYEFNGYEDVNIPLYDGEYAYYTHNSGDGGAPV